ncbi:MAG: nifJ, partial [Chloroflexi bacterium]|nr:nifJ [Chloroflexota bacterium]
MTLPASPERGASNPGAAGAAAASSVDQQRVCIDGNEAVSRVAYAVSEVISIYPITPASSMAEHCDDWAAAGRPNLWGKVPEVIEMQSEAGAAGAMHGALQAGALGATFTASQGLLLMVPNMFKIAGELTPSVIHVSARAVATHALSIFGDHSDVMHARATGWALLAASSVQEAHDFALVAHAATLRARVPFVHFFDGFRTSHEVNRIALLDAEDMHALVREEDILAFRARAMTPDAPVLRGTAQNPDAFFQGREAGNAYYLAVPGIVQEVMDELAERTGRRYGLVDYVGAPDADRVLVVMGSACGAAEETVEELAAAGQRVGLVKVRLFQPFPTEELVAALPSTVRAIAVLDRTKEPGAVGEPLYLGVVTALAERMDSDAPPFPAMPRVIGGRYGLGSKEITPGMIKPVFDELATERPKRHFTVGIVDDVTNLSLPVDPGFRHRRPAGEVQAMFYGLGSDGTVGANRASVKIIGEGTDLNAQGYFVLDSKKSGSMTVSHLRFGPKPIRSSYLVEEADFIACHQFTLLDRVNVLANAKHGATFLLNAPYGPDEVWDHLSSEVQRQLVDKAIDFWVIDAFAVAEEVGMGSRINTIMQPCFFQLAGVLPPDEAIDRIKRHVEKMYAKRGQAVVDRNFAAIDGSLARLGHVALGRVSTGREAPPIVAEDAPEFVRTVTAVLMAGEGDRLPVSAFPIDGTYPTGTTKYERRAIALHLPIWDPAICIDCGKCAIVCPHAAIRMKVYPAAALAGAPERFLSKDFKAREVAEHLLTIQVAPDDCTGCGVCVEVCPAKSKTEARHKAINMEPVADHRDVERVRWDFFKTIAPLDRSILPHDTVKGSQVLEPLFEFSGACGGCGETPYLKLASQLFGDRMIVGNATGCSSIYGANLPTTPWTVNAEGRGPAWNNSLFEDNAEFGLGMRLALDAQADHARVLLTRLAPVVSDDLVRELLDSQQRTEVEISAQRERVSRLRAALQHVDGEHGADARQLLAVAGDLVRKSVWAIGGDGWAYDIGFGGLDQVLSSGRDVNILVLDTEVYSNTGGQASKATPRGAVAKFAAAGKGTTKKDLGAIARSYGNVYVAQIAIGANDAQAVKAMLEADAWPGPSLIIAYSTCIAHGIDMSQSMTHQKDAVRSGYGRRDPLRHPCPDPARAGGRARRPRPGGRRRALAVLRAAGGHSPGRAARAPQRPGRDARRRWPRRRNGRGGAGMSVDLRTRYLGLELRSPLVASPSPLTFELDTVQRLEEAGVAAIVLPSLFEEEIVHEEIELNRSLEQGDEQFAEAPSYFPSIESFAGAGDRYLTRLEQIKARASVPVIASLNASTAGGWVRYGRLIQDAGADALELNIYHLAADGIRTAAEIEEVDLGLVSDVRASITIPLVVKLGPFYSALANLAGRAVERGADGLVIFNRFYEPDLDLEALDVVNRLELSRPSELRLVLRWIAILRSRLGPGVGLAATSGIHTA